VSPKVIDSVRHHWPEEHVALAHPTNFGERYLHDLKGRSTHHEPIIVLHETVSSGESTIRFFQTPHPKDEDQASYHALIRLNGSIYYFVPPDKRAFGAGQSVFVNPKTGRTESVQTNPSLLPSVNNFAYHISLETPPEGRIGGAHPGYTSLQYLSLAWLVAKTGVPEHRITTHQAVDRSGSRNDPRQFNHARFQTLLSVYPKTNEIKIGCP
jgi:N-acetyl-anhydromuramyl-L-alanine amidase AmpD